ncbi:hypothetical protein CKM354_000244200 [Cercospora kikuchii]|uniref:Uncharacterized protein n=1 Tax=Cercospora kikuchii TaxID=84275 RepID=A0A9P3CER1_9PEZI|nr:uncharacterized protein CKM354_000244200 [Cercospora kikuchii]GIZ39050.1 hypothetical protein CKM354_000244200 [Cercospora kikuchii]
MYSQLSRVERRNYYGNPGDPVYAHRLREQRDAYFSSRMGFDYPRSVSNHGPESYETRNGDGGERGQYGYDGVENRDPMRSDPRSYGAAESHERYTSHSRRSRSPTRVEKSGYSQYSAYDYARPTSGYHRSSRQYDPRRDSSSWSSTYAEPRDGYHHGSYDYTRSSRHELTTPAYRTSNTGYPGDRSSAAYSFDGRRRSSRVPASVTSSRIRAPMDEYQRYQHGAVPVQRWDEDRYLADGYGRGWSGRQA